MARGSKPDWLAAFLQRPTSRAAPETLFLWERELGRGAGLPR